jgi:hypothetical protein
MASSNIFRRITHQRLTDEDRWLLWRLRAIARLLLVPLILSNALLGTAAADPPATQPQFATPSLIVHKLKPALQPRMDASVDDPAWHDTAVIPSLALCVGPQAQGLSLTPTQVRVTWNDQYLFVRFRSVDNILYAPHGNATNLLHSDGDVVEIFLDPVGDQRQFFELQCNPVGGWVDGMHVLTTQPTSDSDGVLSGNVLRGDAWFFQGWQIDGLHIVGAPFTDGAEKGWIADFALPAKPILHRLALGKYGPMTMRINFVRYDSNGPPPDAAPTVNMAWSPVVWGRPHRSPAKMGSIVLVER